MTQQQSIHGEWSSKLAFIMAATGSAVGLGNIWKFPYITGENGGGAFVMVYLICIALVGIPIMMAETMLGRRAKQSPINALKALSQEAEAHENWHYLGWLGVTAGFLILSYYSVIAGWASAYVFKSLSGAFSGQGSAEIKALFEQFVASPLQLTCWHSAFMAVTMWVVARGVRGGLEKAVQFMMPSLFLILLILVGYAMTTGHYSQGLSFLFAPDFSKISGQSILIAMGHSFFTLSLGMGAIMVYGAYLPGHVSISKATLLVAGADTAVALLAGVAIFPLVFANQLEPSAGPGLIFQTLPIAFGQMTAGNVIGTLFFILVVFAALSSSISLIEPMVAWLIENHGFKRSHACWVAGAAAWLLGLGTVLSFNHWSEVKLFGHTFFELLDYLTANIMLPVGGFFVAIFAGWVMLREHSESELEMSPMFYEIWRILVRYVAPAAVFVVFLSVVGVLAP